MPRLLARPQVAAPASTHAISNASSDSARFLGPSMKPPNSGSSPAAVMPASSKCRSMLFFSSVHSWLLRAPSATRRAMGPRATLRALCTSIWMS